MVEKSNALHCREDDAICEDENTFSSDGSNNSKVDFSVIYDNQISCKQMKDLLILSKNGAKDNFSSFDSKNDM